VPRREEEQQEADQVQPNDDDGHASQGSPL
jgi:hypothetical protein